MTDEELVEKAARAAENALAKVSGFRVGAAVLCADGRVFTGCNVESPSLLQVFCAERVALLKALSEGARDFWAIAVCAPTRPDVTPCGLCRQMLAEFAPGIRVLLATGEKGFRETTVEQLLPEAFRLE